jgi:hypothetical protein
MYSFTVRRIELSFNTRQHVLTEGSHLLGSQVVQSVSDLFLHLFTFVLPEGSQS